MFTGIITDLGTVLEVTPGVELGVTIGTRLPLTDMAVGASVACNGVCLTAVAVGADRFEALVSAETLSKTTLGGWRVGTPVNLERPLRAGDELGGHLVSGHVDGIAALVDRVPDGGSLRLTVRPPPELLPLIAPKGSVALDGVSLTVNAVVEGFFTVNIIPHTQTWTNLGKLPVGAQMNLEGDMLARYLARLLDQRRS
ncbi:MAG: riboflavin synthase [Alphaproteobacteria bacterium]